MFQPVTRVEWLLAWAWTTLAGGAYSAGPAVAASVAKAAVPHQLLWGLVCGGTVLLLFVATVSAVGARFAIGRPLGGPSNPLD